VIVQTPTIDEDLPQGVTNCRCRSKALLRLLPLVPRPNAACFFLRRVRYASLIIAAAAVANCNESRTQGKVPSAEATLETTANDLWARYHESESAAEAQYGESNLSVTGIVAGLELEGGNRPIVLLATPDDRYPVRAELVPGAAAKAADLREGDQAVFRCRGVTKLAQSPMLLNCTF
jgi:hypothetical protein